MTNQSKWTKIEVTDIKKGDTIKVVGVSDGVTFSLKAKAHHRDAIGDWITKDGGDILDDFPYGIDYKVFRRSPKPYKPVAKFGALITAEASFSGTTKTFICTHITGVGYWMSQDGDTYTTSGLRAEFENFKLVRKGTKAPR